ncbi:cryptochrome/photolyase family protein [Paenirhodobacter populi]|uniref:Deoxyribodipyrimidine photo-lyase n=1 Tax=Paenirhodobacter populi TaxID=2306993 RepID=A0A443J7S2_9RHOB|nr:deoxyribodipyrimidine photo-lyase [Sinirhodobacter populi]RWR05590.1 deoxyribodipyrimidine photo-lyase [Sinirhodobacter populi]RWR16549.1 deoxyribodipyrimidine photo-lyase [Sinirhodobacter populi]
MPVPAILWLCRDFRFDDNAALAAARAEGPVLPVFIVDAATRAQGSASRWRLGRALAAFDAAWLTRTGEHITVLEGEAADLLPGLAGRVGARSIHQNDWPTPALRAVQAALRRALGHGPVRLHLHEGHLLIHPARVKTGAGGSYRVYTPFARAVRLAGPDRPLAAAGALSALPAVGVLRAEHLNLAPDMYRGAVVLAEHGLPAGEAAAFARFDNFLDRAPEYPTHRDRPDIDATSGLSEHLALGEISPRRIWAIAGLQAKVEPALATGVEKFLSELLWREFSWHLLLAFPQMPEIPWRSGWAAFPWLGSNPEAQAWTRAETGIALVDAGLREMRVTGRMHNRVRMVVASWLTKHLLTDWRIGLAHFEDSLTDWDPAANAMNWQWVAGCGPDASPFFRIFNPEKQAVSFDPDSRYRNHWLSGMGAQAFAATLPSSRAGATKWKSADTAPLLARGRTRALAALEAFNRDL